jgi:peptidoglycan/LPS O-acetylase OafA/YrhL
MIDKQQTLLQTRRPSAELPRSSLPMSRGYIPELDGIRGIAALMVITAHLKAPVLHSVRGHFALVMFFVLSGYLITSLTLGEESKRGHVSFSNFYIRRCFRIFPIYYFVLGVYCVLILGLHIGIDKRAPLLHALPFYLTYLQEVPFLHAHAGASLPFYQSWSLGVEEKFYLIWPILCFLLLRQHRAWRIPITITLIFAFVVVGPMPTHYASILQGCLLALLLQNERVRSIITRSPKVGCYALFLTLLALHVFVLPHFRWQYEEAAYAPLFAVFLGFLVSSDSRVNSILRFRPFVAVGKVSYGIYLVHILCLNVVEKFFQSPAASYLGTAALSICIAAALHFTIELPMIQLGRKLSTTGFRRTTYAASAQTCRGAIVADV